MLPESHDPQEWIKAIAYVLFAAIGGMLGYLIRASDNEAKVRLHLVALEGAAAGFVGFMVFLLCQAYHMSPQWTGVVVGVCGWLGASATIRILEGVVFRRLGLEKRNGSAPSQSSTD